MAAPATSGGKRGAETSGPSFAVAFGGGGARGLAHIHVIEALDELGIRPAAIAGTSIGAIMGAAMAAGMSGRAIHDHARALLTRRADVAGRIWRMRPVSVPDLLARGIRISQFDLERILAAFLPPDVPATFGELAIPLSVAATDFYGHGECVIESGDLVPALAASAAIPALFRPVKRDGTLLVDGGIYNPLPFDLVQNRADITIAIDVVGAPEPGGRVRPRTIDLVYGASQLMMQAVLDGKLRQDRPDILLRPPVSRFRALDFLKIDAVLSETIAVKDEVKRAVAAAVAAWPGR